MRNRLPDDPKKLVDLFVESIEKQDEAIRSPEGTSKLVRHYGNLYVTIAKQLLRMSAIDEFATLLDHPNRVIRVAAGVCLFSSIPDRTLATLKEVAEGDDFAAFCARLRIKEWEEHPENYDPSNWK